MGTFATELKSEREKRKISLAHIAAETRISLHHLESLEEGRFGDLPGGMYNRAFLKAYCETLNLNNLPEIMQRYEDELSPASDRTLKSKVHIPQKSGSFRISPLLIWGLMLLISAAGLFFSRRWITAIFSPYFSHTPVSTARYETVKLPATPPATSTTATPGTEPAAPIPAPPESAMSDRALPAAQGPSLPSEPPVTASPSQSSTGLNAATSPPATPIAPRSLRLEISATAQSWVSVDRDGSPAFRKTMEPGEVQVLVAAEKFQIVLGNAGGVRLKINGKPAKPLGKSGAVVKVLIDGNNLQDFLDQATG
jgi:cytoskeleton protein RodZ